jgi:TonB-linked SusC/RagA family outer membrane protein
MECKAHSHPVSHALYRRAGWLTKTLLVMKLTGIFLLATVLQVSARGTAQTVTYEAKGVPLSEAFAAIKQQTGYVFFYDVKDLEGARPVTVKLLDVPLRSALETILAGEPLVFDIQGNTVVITSKPLPPAIPSLDSLPRKLIKVQGAVYNESGEPLSGANVTIKESEKGTVTNARGEFDLGAIPVNSTVVFSYIGFEPQRMKVANASSLKIYLKTAKNELDKIVIQGYGTTTQRVQTGDIVTVSGVEIAKQPGMNPILALQGQVAGLDIVQQNGYGTAPVKVELRGRSFLGQFPSDPLYIVDGVPLTVNEITGNVGYPVSSGFTQNGGIESPGNGQSPLASLNSDDIESVTVLKDADATSIYGSRGANGVILITTKKGKAGKAKFDLKAEQGETTITKFWQMLNTSQYLSVRREALKNDGLHATASNAYDLVVWDTTRSTDWQRALMGGMGHYTNAQGSLSGGDLHNTFRLAGGYKRTTYITTASGADQQGSVSMNLSHKSNSERFKMSMTAVYTVDQSNLASLPGRITFAPDAPAIFNAAGNLNYAGWNPIANQFSFAGLREPFTSNTNFLNANLVISGQLFHGLDAQVSLGYNNAQSKEQKLSPITAQNPASNPAGIAQFGSDNNRNWIVEPQLTYANFIGKGKIDAVAGASLQEATTEGQYIDAEGYTNDDLLRTISNAPTIDGSDNYGQYKYGGIFARANYNWENKYIINLSARRDGSSRFGPGKQFGNFEAAGAAWIFTEENWFKKQLGFLSFGKIKGSYGTTGSDLVSPYSYLTRWSSSGLLTYQNIAPLQPLQHANPYYQWQVNKKLEAGIDLGFAKDAVNLSFIYYRNRCGNQLVEFPTPQFTGFSYVEANSPADVQNSGEEVTLGAKIINSKNLVWSIHFNIGVNQNKLLAYPNFAQSPYAEDYVIGKPLNLARILHYTGVDPKTGQYTYEDRNHDGIISTNFGATDDRYIVNLAPKYFGGLGSDFNYKGLQLTLLFSFKKQIGVNAISQGDYPGRAYNQPVEILGKEWKYPGDKASVARFTTLPQQSDSYFHASDAGYTDASFIRLRNLSLSYSFPESTVKKMGFGQMAIFVRGENLFVITPYKGMDPETQNFGGLQPAKVFTAGISCTF